MFLGLFSFDYTLQIVLAGSALIGFVAGSLGCFAVLRRQSLLGDAISHAALPGVALAFLITQTKSPLSLLLGALIAGWIGTLLVMLITKTTRLKEDAALGIILSVFFGFGIFLLTIIQKLPTAKKAGLDTFLFGNASTLLEADVYTMLAFGFIALLCLSLFWKEFKIISFDLGFAKSLGFPVKLLEVFLVTLLVVAIAIGLQTVGVVLMSALVIGPAVSARQWTDHLGKMVLLAGSIGSISGILGVLSSSAIPGLPTGPAIVVIMGFFVAASLVFSPHRGLLKDWMQARTNKKKIRIASVLLTLLRLSESHKNPFYPHTLASLRAVDATGVEKSLEQLSELHFVEQQGDLWNLTELGLKEARLLEQEWGAVE
ncbi:metal ABC transporter permease [Candidatus Woesearchaeota archaeon]|nr:metal ABC transporter permease [Candidatus Woesearchaeota archaeon]